MFRKRQKCLCLQGWSVISLVALQSCFLMLVTVDGSTGRSPMWFRGIIHLQGRWRMNEHNIRYTDAGHLCYFGVQRKLWNESSSWDTDITWPVNCALCCSCWRQVRMRHKQHESLLRHCLVPKVQGLMMCVFHTRTLRPIYTSQVSFKFHGVGYAWLLQLHPLLQVCSAR